MLMELGVLGLQAALSAADRTRGLFSFSLPLGGDGTGVLVSPFLRDWAQGAARSFAAAETAKTTAVEALAAALAEDEAKFGAVKAAVLVAYKAALAAALADRGVSAPPRPCPARPFLFPFAPFLFSPLLC